MTALEVIDSRHRTTLRWNDMTSSACFNRCRIKPPGHNPLHMSFLRWQVGRRESMCSGTLGKIYRRRNNEAKSF